MSRGLNYTIADVMFFDPQSFKIGKQNCFAVDVCVLFLNDLRVNRLHSITVNGKSQMSPKVEIYTWSTCPFCIRAKQLLNQKSVEFTEYCIDGDQAARSAMAQRANGRRSVPQIFISDEHVGGCDDLHALEAQGKLDAMLAAG